MGPKPPRRPPALVPGSRIALVAPSGRLLEHDDFVRAESLCRTLGFEPRVGRHATGRHGWFAGTDDERLDDLNAALRDDDVDAVWCLRGGVGLLRILDRIDFAALARRPKAVIGYSDITTLLLGILKESGVVAFHGPVARAPMPAFAREHFTRVLTKSAPAGLLGNLPTPPGVLEPREPRVVTVAGGRAEGPLIGGNLTLLQHLVGTRYFPDLTGALLFLEDVSEPLYRIDRMLSHLAITGALDKLSGVIIGRFTEMERETSDGAFGLDEILAHWFGSKRIPVVHGVPIGHIPDQWTIPVGVKAVLDGDEGTVEVVEEAVG
jgi:muramoyltetrapeptide carboxypeptidase